MSKIGIMGGTFDPIHTGHINIAVSAKSEYHLDRVIFLTSGNPPHKRGKAVLDAKIRHIMVKRATSGIDGFIPCDYELTKKEPSYTYETLLYFKSLYPDDELYFIIGGDSLRDFNTWYKPEEILKLCTLLVYDRSGGLYRSDFSKPIHGGKIDISSTQIRSMAEAGEDISGLVPDSVNSFIKRNMVYLGISDYEAQLKKMLTPERFVHSLGVRDTAIKLAKIYGADRKKASIAGLLHDNAKNLDCPYERCRDLEAEPDGFELNSPALIHACLGEQTAKCIFGITDPEILDAIRWHTVGRCGMSLLEKIIFVADLTEPGRSFPDVQMLRDLSYVSIDKAVEKCVLGTIEINEKRGNPVHPNARLILSFNKTDSQ